MIKPQCVKCKAIHCRKGITDEPNLPDYCPIRTSESLINKVVKKYEDEGIHRFYTTAALIEKESYDAAAAREGRRVPVRPRIREIAEFARLMGIRLMGMAFCSGLSDEASRAASILERHGFEVCSVVCSCGSVDKAALGVPGDFKISGADKFEAGCNPLVQAAILEQAGTEVNLLVGLCVGHDMLFTMHSKAPVSTLIVKDRFTGHNPLVSLYTRYHKDVR
jgi:uncharacterized metal-binding protein